MFGPLKRWWTEFNTPTPPPKELSRSEDYHEPGPWKAGWFCPDCDTNVTRTTYVDEWPFRDPPRENESCPECGFPGPFPKRGYRYVTHITHAYMDNGGIHAISQRSTIEFHVPKEIPT